MRLIVLVCGLLWACGCVGALQEGGSHSKMRSLNNHGKHRNLQGAAKGHHHKHHVPKRGLPGSVHNPKMLEDNQLLHDREHLKEELPDYIPMDKIQEMTDKEMDYHYFSMHDTDDNLKLDGLELLAAIMHVSDDDDDDDDDGGGDGVVAARKAGLTEEELKVLDQHRHQQWENNMKFYIDLVDSVMKENDLNNDGYLSWAEFLRGRRRNI